MKPLPTLTQPARYRIRLTGRVKNGWADYLSDAQECLLSIDGAPVTELVGNVPDQSALFGLLCHIRDLGLPLISVEFLMNIEREDQNE